MYIPNINTKGIFTFNSPYDTLIDNTQEFTVTAVRGLIDLIKDGIDPMAVIYTPAGLTINEYSADTRDNLPVVTLVTNGKIQAHIPARYIKEPPKIVGDKFQSKVISLDMNFLPIKLDLTSVIEDIKDTVYDRIGIYPKTEIIPTSPEIIKTKEVAEAIDKLLENKPKVDRSYKTRYFELNTLLETSNEKIKMLKDEVDMLKDKLQKCTDEYIKLNEKYNDCCDE